MEPFFIDRCEVSVGQYDEFISSAQNSSKYSNELARYLSITCNNSRFNGKDLPVTGVSCVAATAYSNWRGRQLPTMLQWLRAAAGPEESSPYPGGGLSAAKKANLKGSQDGYSVLATVKKPGQDVSRFGVLGLTGNVREWTATWFNPHMYAKTPADAPRELSDGILKVVQGGSWRTSPENARRDHSEKHRPNEAFDDVGFRCALPFFADRVTLQPSSSANESGKYALEKR